jgi:DNA mismatch repair protein MutS2
MLNERTLRILEYPKIIEQVESLASSSLGKELIVKLLPLTDYTQIREAQQITSEAVKILIEQDRPPLGGIFDIRSLIKKAAINGVLTPAELLEVASTLRASRLLRGFLLEKSAGDTLLYDWGGRLGSYPGIEREFERCLGPNGEVLDGASPKLRSLRSQTKVYQNRIREKLDSIVHSGENSKYLQDLIVTVRNGRYVIPVKQEYRSLFPGIVHDQSASGVTLFIEPMSVVELSNQLQIIEAQEVEEINRILSELSGRVKEIGDSLQITVNILARLDLAFAKGRYSLAIRGSEPLLTQSGVIDLHNARHPLLTGKVVPISLPLGKKFDTLVITGPNTGGKTVSLKTVGLLTLMAQAGLHIPASSGSEISVFREVFCDIGDEQSIEQSLSTFSSHLTQIVRIIKTAQSSDCLVLLDELGAGTDPAEGAALAMSILTHLHQLGVRTVATTHYSELKAFAYQTEGIENASVEFDIGTLQPTYHLLIGLPGGSQAFEIALKLGLPEFLIEKAREYISAEAVKVEELLREIETDRKKARQDRLITEEARLKGESYQNKLETELSRLKNEKAELLRQAREEARTILLEARRDSENYLRQLRESPRDELPGIVNEARQQLTYKLNKLEEPTPVRSESTLDPTRLKPGQAIRVISLNQTGTILEAGNDNVLVQVGIVKVNLPLNDLELTGEEKITVKRVSHRSSMSGPGLAAVQNISTEISLRGMTVDEALYQLEKYLDQAILAGLFRFRVIHGKGTGTLRQAVQQYLKENPMVKSVYFAEQNEGGLGASVVEIKH